MELLVRLADWSQPFDRDAVMQLLDMYARDPLGSGEPLAEAVRARLLIDLPADPGCRPFLALDGDRPVGLALCFLGYSSFHARRLLNIHDLAVVPEMRGRGVGRALLAAVEQEARRCDCCRLTLEVRVDNEVARRLYRQFGFLAGDPTVDALSFWKKPLA